MSAPMKMMFTMRRHVRLRPCASARRAIQTAEKMFADLVQQPRHTTVLSVFDEITDEALARAYHAEHHPTTPR